MLTAYKLAQEECLCSGASALEAAVSLIGRRQEAGLLLLSKGQINDSAPCGFSPLAMAAYMQWGRGVDLLLRRGADPSIGRPVDAALLGWLQVRECLIYRGARGDVRLKAAQRCSEVVKLLAALGGDLSEPCLPLPQGSCTEIVLSPLR
jgi:hypothetical protein